MAKTIRVPLAQPIVGHGAPITEVVLREPTAAKYWELGEAATWSRTKDDVYFRIENDAVIKAYIEACVVEPKDSLLLGQLSLADAIAVKEAVLGFFSAARMTNSTTSSNGLSSTTESAA